MIRSICFKTNICCEIFRKAAILSRASFPSLLNCLEQSICLYCLASKVEGPAAPFVNLAASVLFAHQYKNCSLLDYKLDHKE